MSFAQKLVYAKMSVRDLLKYPGLKSIIASTRYFPIWQKLIKSKGSTVSEQIPWLTFGAIHFLKKNINDEMNVFEYGSGGSTLFWAKNTKSVVSVEHNREWFEIMEKQLSKLKISNLEYLFREPQPDASFAKKQFQNPDDYISSDELAVGKNFEAYVKSIDAFPDDQFDLIVVDGRARPSCIKHSIKKLKVGGFLVVDNADREYYLAPFDFKRRSWKRWDFSGPVPFLMNFSMTTILKKPAE
jgi:hypothetical protein